MRKRWPLAIVVAVIVMISGFAGFEYYSSSTGSGSHSRFPGAFNVTPAFSTVRNNTTYFNGSQQLVSGTLQLWAQEDIGNQNVTSMYITSTMQNTKPVLQTTIGPSGKGTGFISTTFAGIIGEWRHFLNVSHQQKSETSLLVAINYFFTYNGTCLENYQYNGFVPFSPFSVNLSSVFIFNDHPDLNGYPHRLISIPTQPLVYSGISPDHFPGCVGDNYFWTLKGSNTSYNARIPLDFVNDTSSTQQEITSVTLGLSIGTTSFSAMKGYNESSSYTYILGTQGSWNPNDVVGSEGLLLYPPSVNATDSFGYIYVVGNFTADRFQEYEINCNSGQKTFLNNYYTTIFIDSLNQHKGEFVMGHVYEGYNGSNVFSNASAAKTLGLHNYSTVMNEGNLSVGNQVNWGEVITSLGSQYNNLYGTINGFIGLGMALIGMIAAVGAADGYSPGSGWADTALAIVAITGFVSSIAAFFLAGVVSSSSSTFVYSADIQNSGTTTGANGSPVDIQVYRVSTAIDVASTAYQLPTLWVMN